MKKIDSILLASGGMDSTVLAYKLLNEGKRIRVVFFDYGQHCRETEWNTLSRVLPKDVVADAHIIHLGDIYKESTSRMIIPANLWKEKIVSDDLYLPYRNLLFLTAGSAYAQSIGVSSVYAAFINSNHAKEIDCTSSFFDQLESLLSEYGSVKIIFPFRNLSKTEVAKIGLALSVPIDLTFSCQVSPNNPCGACPNCVDRLEAFNNIGKNHEKQ